MKKRFKRVGAVVLSLAMILGMMPAVTKPLEVQAAKLSVCGWHNGSQQTPRLASSQTSLRILVSCSPSPKETAKGDNVDFTVAITGE